MQASIGRLVQLLIRKEIICKEDAEIYQYGLWSGFLLVGNVLVSVLLLAAAGCVQSGLLYLFLLMLLRSYAGGYHSRSALCCFFLSQGSLIACAWLSERLFEKMSGRSVWYGLAFSAVMALIMIRFSPCEAEGNPLSESEKKHHRGVVCILQGLIASAAVTGMALHHNRILAVWVVLNASILITFLAAAVESRKLAYDSDCDL